ncbi:sodium channel protein type 4 subunit alpha B-like isoform X2 [Brachyistius frenatus]|uniref:sodium channel protein type 4 subunit alpha B-like isoform X2 n=1 Tax=Brachyistius frenatus TaxID=100188 RepID=UPI0037E8C644
MSLFDFWRSIRERGPLLRRTNQLRLTPAQIRLLGNSEVRAVLQNDSMVSLLPPVGTEIFRCFTPASLEEIQRRQEAEGEEPKRRRNEQAAEKDPPKPDTHLEAGKPLPFIYGDPPPELLTTPLEELDPFYQSQKTFIVLSKGHILSRFNAESSCFLLSPSNPLRTVSMKIVRNTFFSLFMMLTVLANYFLMKFPESRAAERVFTAIYTSEAVLKVVSRGFCVGRFTFIRDPWNWLDLLIISTGFLTEFVDLGKFSVLVTIPRVMKIFTVTPGLKKTVEALLQSVRRLADVIILMVFCLSILALIGLQLFMGVMKHKCVIRHFDLLNSTTDYYDNRTGSIHFNYHQYISNPVNYYHLPHHHDALLCGNSSGAGVCPDGTVCLKAGQNPNYGYTSFDSYGSSLLSLFRLMTRDFWDNLVMLTFRAAGVLYVSVSVLVFFPTCFFLLSLLLAMVAVAMVEQEKASTSEDKRREEEFSRIVKVLMSREEQEEEEEASSTAALSQEHNSPQKKKKSAAADRGLEHAAVDEDEEDHRPARCAFIRLFLKGDCCGCSRWLKLRLSAFVMNPFFDLVIVICIVLNTVFMSMEYYPMTSSFEELLSIANLVFVGIFTAEMFLKLAALGLYGYFQVSWHILDFVIVISSLVELGMAAVEGLSLLRIFQLLRVLRLARWWPELHLLMKITWAALQSLTLVLLVMVFMFNVVGMQLFQNDYRDGVCRISADCMLPRWHMHDSVHTFFLIFRVLLGEWIETLWDCMEVSDRTSCVIFFLMVLVIGNLLVLSLFMTLLLSSVSYDKLTAVEGKVPNNPQIAINQTGTCIREHVLSLVGNRNHVDHQVDTKRDDKKEYLALNPVTSDQLSLNGNHDDLSRDPLYRFSCRAPVAEAESEFKVPEDKEEKRLQCDIRADENHKENTPGDCCCDGCYRCCPFLCVDTSQGRGRVWSNFRRTCFLIVQHKYFEAFIVFIILLSCAALVFEDDHLQHRPVLQAVLDRVDLMFTVIFLVEMLLKWIAFGFKKYFSSFWFWLDFLVLDVSLVSLIFGLFGFSCPSLRALRTLRTLSRFQGTRVVLRGLSLCLGPMFSVLLVVMAVWLIFSILGVQMFAGKFLYCLNETSEETFMSTDVANKTECFWLMEANYTEVQWKNPKFTFDNVAMGYLSLIVMTTSTGWLSIMYAAMDVTQVESQPQYEYNLSMFLFFICFMISYFFTFNFFIRVFIDTLHQHRHKFGGKHVFTTKQQQNFIRAVRRWFSKEPQEPVPRPQNPCRARLFDLVTALLFKVVVVMVISLNMVVLMVETDEQSAEKEAVLNWFSFIFIIVYLAEFLLKVVALGRHYFSSRLNILDFVVLIVIIIGLFLTDLIEKYFISPAFFSVLRLARILPFLRLIRHARGIKVLLMGFAMSLPALFNIGLLLLLVMFTFSAVGMFHLAYLPRQMMIDDMFNFQTFGSSVISMLMVSTCLEWHSLLYGLTNTPADCGLQTTFSTESCGSPAAALVFFTSYIFLVFLLQIHLFTAVILETFNAMNPEDAEDAEDVPQVSCEPISNILHGKQEEASAVIQNDAEGTPDPSKISGSSPPTSCLDENPTESMG